MSAAPSPTLPVAVIGAGPVGLAAAAHLRARDLEPIVFEAGPEPASAVSAWGHIRLFSPWRYDIDPAARALLERTGWTEPDLDHLPTGAELVADYLAPLAATPELRPRIRTGSRVVAVSRDSLDRTRGRNRETTPFLVRVEDERGALTDHRVRAVIDASGTWSTPNPLGQAGLPAFGEDAARTAGSVTSPLPDVLGRDREEFADRHVLVVGAGHSAANTLLALAELRAAAPCTRISWAIRSASPESVYGGEDRDGLPARGALGSRLRSLVDGGAIDLHTEFTITALDSNGLLTVHADTPAGPVALDVDRVVPTTGFRPDLGMLREIRLDLDPVVEAPRELGPLIDPEFHSCGTVPPHGAALLAHPDPDFYIVGMKSYGRAPTFLMATGYEQVRSIAAALAGDRDAAERVELVLPETGVCSADLGTGVDADGGGAGCCAPAGSSAPAPASADDGGCCAPAADPCCSPSGSPRPVTLGIPTGTAHGRSAERADA